MLLNIPRALWCMTAVRLNGRTSLYMCACVLEGVFLFVFLFVILYRKLFGLYMLGEKKLNGPPGVWNEKPVCKNPSTPPKIKWLNENCLLWNQQPIRNKNWRWLVENKSGGRKGYVDLWATLKALKTTGSSIETRLLSVRTYRTDLQEYLSSFKRTLF